MTARIAVVIPLLCSAFPGEAQSQLQDPVVRQLKFKGNRAIDGETLQSFIATTNSSFFATSPFVRWMGLGAKRTFGQRDFEADVERLKLLFRKSGYLDVQVDTLVRRTDDNIYITFLIDEGPPVVVTDLVILGLDSIADTRRIIRDLPLRVGDPFNRFLMVATADTLARRLQDRGYHSAEVFQSFDMNTTERTATIGLDVYPGVLGVVGEIDVVGTASINPKVVRSLLTTSPGRTYSREDLFRSQRNLYRSDLFRYVSVGVDTLLYRFDSDTVPLSVRVIEGRFHRLRWGGGYGTNDCIRLGAGWSARNMLGNGRIFDLSTRVSKLGVAEPFTALSENICQWLADDPFSQELNYNVTASIRRPAFLSPKNTLAIALFAERRSSPKVFLREDFGTSLSLARITESRLGLDFVYRWENGLTQASDVNFCAYFNACTREDIDELRQRQNLGTFTIRSTLPRANNLINPTRGYVASLEGTISSSLIGSSATQEFVRFIGDIAWYHPIRRGYVLSWRVRGGIIFAPRITLESGTDAFIPPNQRFYAGGPNDVRGYHRNELGPVVYVIDESQIGRDSAGNIIPESLQNAQVEATGGDMLSVGNVELRMPTGISPRLRFALFIDAGSVWVRDPDAFAPFRLRITPGAGLRFNTPLGPARFDVAYNPYDFPPGRLLASTADGDLVELPFPVQKARTRNFTIQVSVGQPF
ncbi:MAG: BamA/TamA family outer membrane protein [Gemmatimonadales bacterium]